MRHQVQGDTRVKVMLQIRLWLIEYPVRRCNIWNMLQAIVINCIEWDVLVP